MTFRFRSRFLVGFVSLAMSAACDVKHGSTPTTPSAVTAGAGSGSALSLLGVWTSGAPALDAPGPDVRGCGDFQWTVSTQSSTSATGGFSMTCLGGVTLAGTASAQLSGTTVQLNVTGTGNLPAIGKCGFSISGTGQMDGDVLHVPYTGNTCLGPVSGTEVLHRNQVLPTPPAATPLPPAPAPPPPPALPAAPGADGIDMGQAAILNSPLDLASWPITTAITTLNIGPSGIAVDFSKKDGPGRWPDVTPPGWSGPLQYTLGMCLFINGRWNCSAVVEFWYGLDESGGPPSQFAQDWFYDPTRWAPMTGHQPAVGETVGFFVCAGDCRNNRDGTLSPARERSNIVLVPMPGNGGAIYRF